MPIRHSTISTQTASIRVSESDGTGLPLVLIHGSGASRQVFERQFASSLAERHQLLALDLPGHGESTDAANGSDYAIPALADSVAEVLALRGISHAAIFGWSLGGHIGIELLSRVPAVAGLMITGTPPVSPGPLGMLRGFQTNWDLLLASKEQFSERDIQRFYELCYGGRGDERFLAAIRRADGRVRPAVSRGLMRGDGADQRWTVEHAVVPVAVVNGATEPFARLSYVASLDYPTLWGGQCHIVPDAGHAPFWDQPEAFNALLGQFAADVEDFSARAALPLVRTA